MISAERTPLNRSTDISLFRRLSGHGSVMFESRARSKRRPRPAYFVRGSYRSTSLATVSATCYKAVSVARLREKHMEPTTPPPEPTAVTPQQVDATATQFTSQPNDDPRWPAPQPPRNVGSSSAIPVFVFTTVALLGTCLLGALLGSWVLVLVGLIAGLLVFHYVVWGWLY